MTTDFRALCAELAQELERYQLDFPAKTDKMAYRAMAADDALARARAALAEPEPVADGEAEEPPEAPIWLNNAEAAAWQSGWTCAAAELLERLAEPEPVGPTNQYIEALHHAVFASRLHGPPPNTSFEVDFARAVLARWRQP